MTLISQSDPPEAASDIPSSKRERAPITEEEDRPLEDSAAPAAAESLGDRPQIQTIAEKEQAHKHKVEDYKNRVSVFLLVACFFIIVIFAAADAWFKVESTLFTGAFEFAKTIATAVIGYLFAVNTKEK